jgi:RNA polymerase sigma factor (sigma-70 family)
MLKEPLATRTERFVENRRSPLRDSTQVLTAQKPDRRNGMDKDLYSTLPDEMLGRLLYTGDEKAYEAIYRRHWRSLYSLAVWKTSNPIAAEEMVQDLFLTLWENRGNTLIEKPEPYLKGALRYNVIGFIKTKLLDQQARIGDLPDPISPARADGDVDLEELSQALAHALTLLPDKTRQVFQMSRFEQRSTPEIAKLLGITDRAVEYHITQSLRLLRFQLKDYLSYAIVCAILGS